MSNKESIVCLVGKSGSGKTTIVEELRKQGIKPLDSYTTRSKRFDNEKGRTFISKTEFSKLRDNLIAHTVFDDHEYGATYEQVRESDIYIIDPKGVKDLKEKLKPENIIVVYLETEDMVRYNRMVAERGDEEATRRVEHDTYKFLKFITHKQYDFLLSNNDKHDFKRNLKVLKTICEIASKGE